MEKFIPSVSQLTKDISAIYIDDDLNYHYVLERLRFHLEHPIGENPDLTYEEIIKRYQSHIDQWNQKHSASEKRGFLGKKQGSKRKNFLEFLEVGLYSIDWESQSNTPERDLYLFGNVKHDFLSEQRKAFVNDLKFLGS